MACVRKLKRHGIWQTLATWGEREEREQFGLEFTINPPPDLTQLAVESIFPTASPWWRERYTVLTWRLPEELILVSFVLGAWWDPDILQIPGSSWKKRQVDCTITRLRGPLFLAGLINVSLLQYKASSWRVKYVGSLPMCRHEQRKSRKNEVSPVNAPLPFTRKWHYKVALMKLRYMIYLRKGSFNCHKDAHSSLM